MATDGMFDLFFVGITTVVFILQKFSSLNFFVNTVVTNNFAMFVMMLNASMICMYGQLTLAMVSNHTRDIFCDVWKLACISCG